MSIEGVHRDGLWWQRHDPHVIADCDGGIDPTGDYWAECVCGWWFELGDSREAAEAAVEAHRAEFGMWSPWRKVQT